MLKAPKVEYEPYFSNLDCRNIYYTLVCTWYHQRKLPFVLSKGIISTKQCLVQVLSPVIRVVAFNLGKEGTSLINW